MDVVIHLNTHVLPMLLECVCHVWALVIEMEFIIIILLLKWPSNLSARSNIEKILYLDEFATL